MKTNSSFSRTTGIIMLDPETLKHLGTSIIHPNRNQEMVFHGRLPQQGAGCFIKTNNFCNPVELGLRIGKGIVRRFAH
jgi:hypothetical protein